MKKKLLEFFLLIPFLNFAQTHKLVFETSYGNFKVMLYDFTPKHRDLVLNSLEFDLYKDVFFNRIIENFVVQGGLHDDEIEKIEENIPVEKRKRLSPEFDKRAFHKIGALGAGRDENTTKSSFLNQIYFVVGKPVSENDLQKIETQKGIKFSLHKKEIYLKEGGLPKLDGDYTVFGEVIEGLEVLIEISKTKTNEKDAPLKPIWFRIIEEK